MATTIETLKKKRTGLRTQTTKIFNKIETILKDESISLDEKFDILNISKDQLNEKYDVLKKLNSDIQDLTADADFEKEIESSENYSERIIESRYKITKFLNEYNTKIQSNFLKNVQSNNTSNSNVNVESTMKLPKLAINKFYGDSSKWLEFYNQFQNAIEKNPNLTSIDKFCYLKSLLGNSAYNVVAGFSLTEENFKAAIDSLKNRYGREDLVINAHMSKILNLKQVKNAANIKELRDLYDNCEIQIRNLNSLGVTAGSFGHLLCPILLKLIPSEIALEFNRKRSDSEKIDVNDLLSFIKKEIESRETTLSIQNSEQQTGLKKEKFKYENKYTNFKREIPTASALTTNVKNICIFCNSSEHDSKLCKGINIPEKRQKLKVDGRCFVCFRRFHIASKCRYNNNNNPCKKCPSKFHTTSICLNNISDEPTGQVKENDSSFVLTSVSQCSKINKRENIHDKQVILQTASVSVESGLNSEIGLLLFDSASQKSFVTRELVSKLNAPIIRQEQLQIFPFAAIKPITKFYDVVELKLSHKKDKSRFLMIQALVTEIISSAVMLPPRLPKEIEDRLSKYDLFNCESVNGQINLLLGADFYFQICLDRKVIQLTNSLYVCESLFGYSLCGYYDSEEKNKIKSASVFNLSVNNSEMENLSCLWNLETIGIKETENISEIDKDIMNTFENNLKFVNNRYETGLIWKGDKNSVGNNFRVAKKRFDGLVRKLDRDNDLCKNYKEIVSEQLSDGIVEECPNKIIENGYFMPHNFVIRDDKVTTRIRMVFDASSKENYSNSLNQVLYSGLNLQPNILDVLINFRIHNIAFCADLEKAFLQIGVKQEDRDYLKFLWFGEDKDDLKFLRFTRIAFGLTCSPFILSATIKHHIKKYNEHPEVIKVLDSFLYMDDLVTGCKSVEEAFYLSSTAYDIFKEAGMNLRKFNTNSVKLKKMWQENKLGDLQENVNNSLKVLGLHWDTRFDILHFEVQSFPDEWKLNPTKRVILKAMLKIFDPIGFIAPFTVRMKSLLQEIWQRGLDWDEILPWDLRKVWDVWCSEIEHLDKFEIPRKYFPQGIEFSDSTEIYIFCDASPQIYGAICYLRNVSSDNKVQTSFIWAKCRVAPIKRLTIPRLELMGAVIAARMSKYLKKLFNYPNLNIYIYSDSTITLHWIKGSALNWKPFVSNRVVEIQTLTDPQMWNYTSGKNNPSDLLTRGENLMSLAANKLWFYGPEWLSMPKELWPKTENIIFKEDVSAEKRSTLKSPKLACLINTITEPLIKLENFSGLYKVYRITAWVFRFLNNLNKKKIRISGELTASEIENAEKFWVGHIQKSAYQSEIDSLKSGNFIDKDSSLYNLNPTLDENGLLIVSGRLQFSNFTQNEKHPWILPYGGYFLKLIIQHAHEKVLHFGVASTLAYLRKKFFIVKGRKYIKSVLRNCIICNKFKASPGKQDIAPLPRDRIVESAPFSICAIDFAGPIFIKTKTESNKAYIVLFTCAVTRAIHLEVTSNLSTETFILALKRFISRRGLCNTIYSDNAKTFIKTDAILKEIWSQISRCEVQKYFAANKITWKYIVPRASWWGGFWERMVRSVKTPLKKILGKTCLTYEEIQTTLAEIEAVINSRPLTYVYDDSNEPQPLTPSLLLIGNRINSLPDIQQINEPKSNKNVLTKLFRYRQQVINHFWNRWRKEYLLELRSANFSTPVKTPTQFKIDEVVLIHEDKVPKHMWKCGRIKELIFGRDSKVRSCILQTSNGQIKRPIQLLYKLELDLENLN